VLTADVNTINLSGSRFDTLLRLYTKTWVPTTSHTALGIGSRCFRDGGCPGLGFGLVHQEMELESLEEGRGSDTGSFDDVLECGTVKEDLEFVDFLLLGLVEAHGEMKSKVVGYKR